MLPIKLKNDIFRWWYEKQTKAENTILIIMLCYRVYYKAIAKLTASSIKKQLPSMHKTHTGLSDAQAEIEYLKVG